MVVKNRLKNIVKTVRRKRKIAVVVLILFFSFVAVFFGVKIAKSLSTYGEEEKIHNQLEEYAPGDISDSVGELSEPTDNHATVINQSLAELKNSNSDLIGWIRIPGTALDYPFVQTSDNEYYLNKSFYKKYLETGTVFLDYRNNADFLDYYSLLYGHHMKNGSVFGAISDYENQEFFDNHKTGWLYTLYQNFRIDFFAYLVVGGEDENVYNPEYISQADNAVHIEYFQKNARTANKIAVKAEDRLIVLSTCNYEFGNARSVLVGRIVPIVSSK